MSAVKVQLNIAEQWFESVWGLAFVPMLMT
jgi:hypothetical protein